MSMEQKLTMIVAASENNVIGKDGALPWKLSGDMKHFKDLTMNHPVVMGRKTYFSIPEKFRPLPGRRNIILSRTMEKEHGFYVARDVGQAFMFMGGKNSYIIGGEEIYKLFFPHINEIELTRVHKNIEGDAFLPEINWNYWYLKKQSEIQEENKLEYSFFNYGLKQ